MDDQTYEGLTPAAPGSRLATLRERRAAAAEKLYTDLQVPRLDPPVFVRYAAVPLARINAATKALAKSKDADKDVVSNAVILAGACQGVFQLADDGTEVSIDPESTEWPRFDEHLAEMLGVEATSAATVVRALYLTDGDVVAAGAELARFSGYSAEDLERDIAGN